MRDARQRACKTSCGLVTLLGLHDEDGTSEWRRKMVLSRCYIPHHSSFNRKPIPYDPMHNVISAWDRGRHGVQQRTSTLDKAQSLRRRESITSGLMVLSMMDG